MTENTHESGSPLAPDTPADARAGRDNLPVPLPVTFGDEMTPFDIQGRYVPHHRDERDTVHFFSIVDRPPVEDSAHDMRHELRYFRARSIGDDITIHNSQPVMPVADPATSPWPLPALQLHLENGDLEVAQTLARNTAHEHGLPFLDTLPALGAEEPEPAPESGWYHFDTALVSAMPQGVDDGYSVGVVDVYANYQDARWAARYLPLGEFDKLDEALDYELGTLELRSLERESTPGPAQLKHEPARYERIALAEADAALTDLLEQNDGHLPPDYEGDHEPAWEPLTSKEWHAYRDYVQTVADANPDVDLIPDRLPTATPPLADDKLISTSIQPDAPYLRTQDFVFEDFKLQDVAPTWQLEVVPAHDTDGEQLGYSAVCVVDFADLAEAVSPDAPERAQWLEVAQFQTEERAQQFREDFMSVSGMEELSHITGPAFAKAVADDLGMNGKWQTMDEQSLEQFEAGEWRVAHKTNEWKSLEMVGKMENVSFDIGH